MTERFHRSDANQYPTGFRVVHRNYGHWDIVTQHGRAFRIRGGPGEWIVFDERTLPGPTLPRFKEQSAAMAYICAEMMHELLATESQDVTRIEDWNVSSNNQHFATQQ